MGCLATAEIPCGPVLEMTSTRRNREPVQSVSGYEDGLLTKARRE